MTSRYFSRDFLNWNTSVCILGIIYSFSTGNTLTLMYFPWSFLYLSIYYSPGSESPISAAIGTPGHLCAPHRLRARQLPSLNRAITY